MKKWWINQSNYTTKCRISHCSLISTFIKDTVTALIMQIYLNIRTTLTMKVCLTILKICLTILETYSTLPKTNLTLPKIYIRIHKIQLNIKKNITYHKIWINWNKINKWKYHSYPIFYLIAIHPVRWLRVGQFIMISLLIRADKVN